MLVHSRNFSKTFVSKTYIFFHGMSTKFTTKNLKNLLTNPSAFGKCGKGKVVRINLTQA